MYFRTCRKVSCGCCSLGFVLGGSLTVVLVLHLFDSHDNYTAKKDMTGVTPVIVGYSSTQAHSLRSEALNTMEGQRKAAQSENTIEPKTSEISKTTVKFKPKEKTITTYKEEIRYYALLEDLDCGGNDLIDYNLVATPQECASICEANEGCVAFGYDERPGYMHKNNCYCKHTCQHLKHLEHFNTYLKGMDHMGCGVFDGKKSCYNIPLHFGHFDDMTQYCKKLNMQMVVLETWEEYKFISDMIKRDDMTKQMHISLKRISGNFTWIYPNGDMAKLDYGGESAWAPDEPDVYPGYECAYFWDVHRGQWDNYLCTEMLYTICEIMY